MAEKSFKCGVCKLILSKPFQTNCGHRYCESCLKGLVKSSKKCPEDDTVLTMENIFPDKFCELQIAELETRCSNRHQGCDWTGPLKFLKEHDSECIFKDSRAQGREHFEKNADLGERQHVLEEKHQVLEEQMGKQQEEIHTLRISLDHLYALFGRYVTGTQEVNAN